MSQQIAQRPKVRPFRGPPWREPRCTDILRIDSRRSLYRLAGRVWPPFGVGSGWEAQVVEFLSQLFDGSDFPARWHCGNWSSGHGYLHIVSDVSIFLAYLAIPILLIMALRVGRRGRVSKDLKQLGILFTAFILFCGITHLNEAIIFYHPMYRFAGVVKLSTAVVSWATVIALFPATLRLLRLRTEDEFKSELAFALEDLRVQRDASKAAEELLQLSVDASPSGMLAVDHEGNIVLENAEAARLFGYERGELLGRSVDILIPEQFAETHPGLRRLYTENPTTRKMGGTQALSGKRKDGSTFPLEVGLNPIQTPRGKVILCAIVDRSLAVAHEQALKTKTEELEQTNEELEGFASAASHDLKAPLRAIQNAATWLEEDLPVEALDQDSRENLRLLKSRAARMDTLLNALLEYARAGRVHLASEQFSSSATVADIVFLLGDRARAVVSVQGELPILYTPKVPFEQVLFNLISNALKHGQDIEDLRVTVSAEEREGEYFFSVADNGPGIAQEFFERVFEVFRTLRPRDEVEGAGMGLALVKKIVEHHGGRVTLESQLGEGSVFRFSWPRRFP